MKMIKGRSADKSKMKAGFKSRVSKRSKSSPLALWLEILVKNIHLMVG